MFESYRIDRLDYITPHQLGLAMPLRFKASRLSFALDINHQGEQMNTEHGKLEGDIEISSELKLHGMITGNAIVKNGGVLHLHGMVSRNLIVEPGGIANIPGMVSGDAINKGGELYISGTIVGRLVKEAGITNVEPNAAIGSGSNV